MKDWVRLYFADDKVLDAEQAPATSDPDEDSGHVPIQETLANDRAAEHATSTEMPHLATSANFLKLRAPLNLLTNSAEVVCAD